MQPAILLLEFDSIAVGIDAGDAMAKRANLTSLHAGTVHPGKYLVLAGGEVAEVEEARVAGRGRARGSLLDEIYLPEIHPDVVDALTGARRPAHGEALGILETKTVSAVIAAADAGVKAADVAILEIRLADGLGGKGYVLFSGQLHDVEAAVASGAAKAILRDHLIERIVIPNLDAEMLENLSTNLEFGARVRATTGG